MTDDEYARRRHAVESWGNAEIERIAGSPPVSSCPKVDELLHAAVVALAKRVRHAHDIEAIEIIVERVLEVIDADFHGMERLEPETGDVDLDERVRRAIAQWDERWTQEAI